MKLFISSEKQLGHLRLGIFQKKINFLKNPDLLEDILDKISLVFRLSGLSCDATFIFAQSLRAAWLFMVKVC